MDPFVRRLIRRLHEPGQPLSRNRHFHTFETPEGRRALRTSRRLRALQRQILECQSEGGVLRVQRSEGGGDELRIELRIHRANGRCVSRLGEAELELLSELPGVREALEAAEQDS